MYSETYFESCIRNIKLRKMIFRIPESKYKIYLVKCKNME
jgi:hypothetical protein